MIEGALDIASLRKEVLSASLAVGQSGAAKTVDVTPGVYVFQASAPVLLTISNVQQTTSTANPQLVPLQNLVVDSGAPLPVLLRGSRLTLAALTTADAIVTWTPVLPLVEAWQLARSPVNEAVARAGGSGKHDL